MLLKRLKTALRRSLPAELHANISFLAGKVNSGSCREMRGVGGAPPDWRLNHRTLFTTL